MKNTTFRAKRKETINANFTLRMKESELIRLREIAEENGVSLGSLIRTMIGKELLKNEA